MPEQQQQTLPNGTDTAVREIEIILDELAELVDRCADRQSFYPVLLRQSAVASTSVAAAIWTVGPENELALAFHWSLDNTDSNSLSVNIERDRELLGELLEQPQPTVINQNTRSMGVLIGCPIRIFEQPWGILVFYLSDDTSESIGRAFLPFATAIAELVVEFEKNLSFRMQQQQIAAYQKLFELTTLLHETSSTRKVAFDLANDGRAFLQCDRVSIVKRGGLSDRFLACSGISNIDTRSNTMRSLKRLATRVLNSKKPFVYFGEDLAVAKKLKPAFFKYQSVAKPQYIAIVPLHYVKRPQSNSDDQTDRTQPAIGAVIAENFRPTDPAQAINRLNLLSIQANSAMSQAARYEQIPLRWLWTGLYRVMCLFRLNQLPKTVVFVSIAAAMVIAGFLIQTDFNVEIRGELQPVTQRHVFAPVDAEIERLFIAHGDWVEQGTLLAHLDSTEIEREIKQIEGELETIEQRINGLEIAISQSGSSSQELQLAQTQLAAGIAEQKQKRQSLLDRRKFYSEQEKKLLLASPIAGQVVTWNLQQLLLRRPVRQGESLFRIADTNGDWHLVFEIPDRKIGYILEAKSASVDPLKVDFIVATDPSQQYEAQLATIANVTHINDEKMPVVRTTSTFEPGSVPSRRVGATVIGHVRCGRKSLFYVWTHDLINALRRRFLW